MKKRTYAITVCLFALLLLAVNSIYAAAGDGSYVAAVTDQSKYTLKVSTSRGMIYDCNMQPLVSAKEKLKAAVAPTIETIGYLSKLAGESDRSFLASMLENGKPFVMDVTRRYDNDGIVMFKVPERYSTNQLAQHLIGYLDGEGNGAAGIELAMDEVLKRNQGEISIDYCVDALGRVIPGEGYTVTDTTEKSTAGVVLTIDSGIQAVAQQAAKRLKCGAVVVTEVPNCEVRAMVSVPGYSQLNPQEAMESESSPYVNRAIQAYTPGSVFKLVVAAAELENGNPGYEYECRGSVHAGDMEFSCYGGYPHGKVNLETAVSKSCNCYFINAARAIGSQNVLAMAYNLGFGNSTELAKDLETATGNLPSIEDLSNSRALANFSFGQGDLTATPLQIAAMTNAIAAEGRYTEPKVVAGLVDGDRRFTVTNSVQDTKMRVMSSSTARTILEYMQTASNSGTAKAGRPIGCVSGAKTGTAQTGIYSGDDELNHYWYTGYISDEYGPRYCITVLYESTITDDGATAAVFKEISEYINASIF